MKYFSSEEIEASRETRSLGESIGELQPEQLASLIPALQGEGAVGLQKGSRCCQQPPNRNDFRATIH